MGFFRNRSLGWKRKNGGDPPSPQHDTQQEVLTPEANNLSSKLSPQTGRPPMERRSSSPSAMDRYGGGGHHDPYRHVSMEARNPYDYGNGPHGGHRGHGHGHHGPPSHIHGHAHNGHHGHTHGHPHGRGGERHAFFREEVDVREAPFHHPMNEANSVLSDSFEDDLDDMRKTSATTDASLRKKHRAACKHLKQGEFNKSLKIFEEILASLLQSHGLVHQRVGAALHNVGIVKLLSGNLTDALDAMEEAVSIRKRTLGPHDAKVTDSLIELGIILLTRKEYGDSLEIFYEALDMREEEVERATVNTSDIEANNLSAAKILNNIGCVHYERGELDESRKKFEAAVDLLVATLEEADPLKTPGFSSMASVMCNLGYIYVMESNFGSASGIFTKALKAQRRIRDEDSKIMRSILDNLGYCCAMEGNMEESLKAYEELLKIQQKYSSTDLVEHAETMKKIVYCRSILFQYDKALEELQEIEKIQLKLYGPASKQLAKTRKVIGEVNYQVLKFPNPVEAMVRSFCGIPCVGTTPTTPNQGTNVTSLSLSKPVNSCKMSGHKVTHAC
mmetsp:Transcript_28592/g.43955  ORF Transcript_28592/g.43955 Transcript_28592/m.43955 type:complete len:560 (-) Transcript_28592:132-1811(-)